MKLIIYKDGQQYGVGKIGNRDNIVGVDFPDEFVKASVEDAATPLMYGWIEEPWVSVEAGGHEWTVEIWPSISEALGDISTKISTKQNRETDPIWEDILEGICPKCAEDIIVTEKRAVCLNCDWSLGGPTDELRHLIGAKGYEAEYQKGYQAAGEYLDDGERIERRSLDVKSRGKMGTIYDIGWNDAISERAERIAQKIENCYMDMGHKGADAQPMPRGVTIPPPTSHTKDLEDMRQDVINYLRSEYAEYYRKKMSRTESGIVQEEWIVYDHMKRPIPTDEYIDKLLKIEGGRTPAYQVAGWIEKNLTELPDTSPTTDKPTTFTCPRCGAQMRLVDETMTTDVFVCDKCDLKATFEDI